MLSSSPLSPMSPAWLLAMVTTLMPLLAIAGARSGLPLMTTSFQPWASPPVVSGLSRFTKPKSLFSNVGATLLNRSLPMLATTPLTPNPPMTSPPAVTEKVGAAVGVGLGDGVGDDSADGEAEGAGDAAVLAAGPACSAVRIAAAERAPARRGGYADCAGDDDAEQDEEDEAAAPAPAPAAATAAVARRPAAARRRAHRVGAGLAPGPVDAVRLVVAGRRAHGSP